VSRGVRGNALVKASERQGKERLYALGVKGNITSVRQNAYRPFRTLLQRKAEATDNIDRIFGDKPALRQKVLLSTIVTCLDRLL